MRKIIAYIATSADGYIARPDGGIEWLDRPQSRGDYGMSAFLRSIDTILWGRNTYDLTLKMGQSLGQFGANITNYVFTHRPAKESGHAQFVSQPVASFAKRLRARRGKNIWMTGGSWIIASFLDAGQIVIVSRHDPGARPVSEMTAMTPVTPGAR